MAIALGSAHAREEVLAGIAGDDLRLVLTVGGEDLSAFLLDGEWGQAADAPPISLDATLALVPPRRLENAEVRLGVEAAGVYVPQLASGKSAFVPGEEYGLTDLWAATPGALLAGEDALRLGATTATRATVDPDTGVTGYYGVDPRGIALDALLRCPYEPALVTVEPVSSPALTFAGTGDSPGFVAEETPGDVLSRLSEAVGYRHRDTAHRGHRAYLPVPLARGQATVATLWAGEMADWTTPARLGPRYHSVRVFGTDPDGSLVYEVVERIGHAGHANPPLPGQVLDIPLDDAAEGRARALREALERGRGLHAGEATWPRFFPLLETDDRFAVHERHEEGVGPGRPDVYERLWLCRVDAYKHALGDDWTTTTAYTASLVEEERVAVPDLIVPPAAARSLPTAVVEAPAFYPSETLYPSDGLFPAGSPLEPGPGRHPSETLYPSG